MAECFRFLSNLHDLLALRDALLLINLINHMLDTICLRLHVSNEGYGRVDLGLSRLASTDSFFKLHCNLLLGVVKLSDLFDVLAVHIAILFELFLLLNYLLKERILLVVSLLELLVSALQLSFSFGHLGLQVGLYFWFYSLNFLKDRFLLFILELKSELTFFSLLLDGEFNDLEISRNLLFANGISLCFASQLVLYWLDLSLKFCYFFVL